MADGISDLKVVTDGLSVWIPVVSALTGGILAGGVALLVSWQTGCAMSKESQRKRKKRSCSLLPPSWFFTLSASLNSA